MASLTSLTPKKPVEVLDYKFNWDKMLAASNDHIVGSSFILSGNSTSTISANSFNATSATVWLSGGTSNTTNVIINIIHTSGGRTIEAGAKIKVQDLSY